MLLREIAERILNLYNYYTGAVITDKDGNIVYYYGGMKEVNSLEVDEVIGRNVLEVYPSVKKEESSIYSVLKTGVPLYDVSQRIVNSNGEVFDSVNSTFPIKDGDEIVGAVEIYYYDDYDEIQYEIDADMLKGSLFNLYSAEDIISESKIMDDFKSKIGRISMTDSTVLIYGETGTGKELVAQAIHSSSARRDKNFIAQNCAAIPQNLLESILFGTVKGSYTDAKDKPGLLEVADGGTLFLDEIHSMDWNVQAKLLKAIEEKKFYRVGGTESIPVDIRVITAVNIDPAECVAQGKLREDLYYRLNVIRLNISPLRDRKEDIKSLTEHFIDMYNKKMKREIKGVSDEVMEFFQSYDWWGNIRELKNVIECAFNFAQGDVIQLEDIDCYEEEIEGTRAADRFVKGRKIDLKKVLKEYEKDIIENALRESRNYTEAAERLGISKQALNNKMNDMGILREMVKTDDSERTL
ncbi:MAG: sigma-54 interaction domain-containing protein [Anaerovoracaceae bacterium]